MSCYNWERGTIRFPSAEVPALRKLLVAEQNRLRQEIKDHCVRIWKDVLKQTRSNKVYIARLDEYERSFWDAPSNAKRIPNQVFWLLTSIVEGDQTPRQVREADLDRYYPKATNRTKEFRVGYEGSITIDGNNVTWDVPENNHAVEHARAHPMAVAFFRFLERVTWTRGSGGELIGNDEYNQDADYAGGGGNYVTAAYGSKATTTRRY